jgi:hypothetical protein
MIAVDDQLTAGTLIGSFRQGHLLPVSTPAACLTGIGRIDLHELPASLFRFAGQFTEELRPGRVTNAFSQTMVVSHAVDVQVFDADDPKPVSNLPTFLMSEGITLEGDPLMHTRNHLALFGSFLGTLLKCGELALHARQVLLFLTEKARVRNLLSCRKARKGFESNVNPHAFGTFRQTFGFALDRERDVPLASRGTLDSTRFDLALNWAMVDHLDATDLGETDTVIRLPSPADNMGETEARLWEGEGVIPVLPLKAGIARFLSMFSETAEECLESQVNAYRHVLQNLRMNARKRWTFLFKKRKGILLLKTGEGDTVSLIGSFAHFQQVVIEPTALIKSLVQLLDLFLGWIETVLVHFQHVSILAQTQQEFKREAAPYLPQTSNGFHPHA